MLSLIGLGLGTKEDITVKGLDLVKKADLVYLEYYTSILQSSKEEMEAYYGKDMLLADRSMVEADDNQILDNAQEKNVVLLVIGDPMCATTHIDLYLRAKKKGIATEIVHNASIISAVGITGLQVYKFGKVTSIPFDNEKIDTPYTVLKQNKAMGLHTLFLLDLQPEENKFMTVNQALTYILNKEKEKKENIINETTLAIGLARIGSKDQIIKAKPIKELLEEDFGGPVHSVIIPGDLHFMEEEALNQLS